MTASKYLLTIFEVVEVSEVALLVFRVVDELDHQARIGEYVIIRLIHHCQDHNVAIYGRVYLIAEKLNIRSLLRVVNVWFILINFYPDNLFSRLASVGCGGLQRTEDARYRGWGHSRAWAQPRPLIGQ